MRWGVCDAWESMEWTLLCGFVHSRGTKICATGVSLKLEEKAISMPYFDKGKKNKVIITVVRISQGIQNFLK